jgi:hypothetical protein
MAPRLGLSVGIAANQKTPEKDFPGIRVYSRTHDALANRAMKKVPVIAATFLAASAMSCAAQKSQPFTGEIEKNASPQRHTAGRLGRRSGFAEMGF